jgi:serine/threonine protein kinase/tetratricopeptide (TPR) repeat protein
MARGVRRLGAYTILREIGRGGMGSVFLARRDDGSEVALKVLHAKSNAGALARFEREGRLLHALGEEGGFVPLLDHGRAEEDVPYLVMPFVKGGTLRARLDKGTLSVSETVALGKAIASAVGRAHARGIVHRDLKPENVLFTSGGIPLVADLGLAKHFRADVAGATETRHVTCDGLFRGTLGYVAREQMRRSSDVGPQADVFALGAILYECLAGVPAFEGDSAIQVIHSIELGIHVPLATRRPDVPPALAHTIERALSREPGDRPPDGAALAAELARSQPARREPARPLRVPVTGSAAALAMARARRSSGLLLVPVVAVAPLVLATLLLRSPRHASGAPSKPEITSLVGASTQKPPADLEAMARAVSAAREEASELAVTAREEMLANALTRAIEHTTRAIELDEKNVLAWTLRAEARRRTRDFEGAFADATRAIELDGGRPLPFATRADAGKHLGRTTVKDDAREAIAAATRTLERSPGDLIAWVARGLARISIREYDASIADMTQAIAIEPRETWAWFIRGSARLALKDASGAIPDLDVTLERKPDLALAWERRAQARLLRHDTSRALEDFGHAIQLDPRSVDALRERGDLHRKLGRTADAIADLDRALELEPANVACLEARAACRAGDMRRPTDAEFALAIVDLDRAVELAPRSFTAWYMRGAIRANHGDVAGGIADYRRALEIDPRNALVWHNRGVLQSGLGSNQAALDDFTRAVELEPENAFMRQNRGRTRALLGDRAGAIEDFEKALALEPEATWAAKVRQILDELKAGFRLPESRDAAKLLDELQVTRLDVDRTPLTEVLRIVAGKTKLGIAVDPTLDLSKTVVTLHAKEMSLRALLARLLEGHPEWTFEPWRSNLVLTAKDQPRRIPPDMPVELARVLRREQWYDFELQDEPLSKVAERLAKEGLALRVPASLRNAKVTFHVHEDMADAILEVVCRLAGARVERRASGGYGFVPLR